MSATTATNGKPRKQLSDQLDRLDGIIDVLADGLPAAVTDACKEGACQAVKDAIIEILTNPDLRALLATARAEPAPAPAPAPEPRPGPWARFKARLAATRSAVGGALARARSAVVSRCQAVRAAVALLGTAVGEPLPVRRAALVAGLVGVATGAVCLAAPQAIAAVVGAAGAATTTAAVQAGHWLRTGARRLGLIG